MRCSDDGEPSGTAGRPMLDILDGQGIYNVVAVVTRYFGGTLLGTGGLVRAYSGAMKEGLNHCVLLEKETGYPLTVTADYNEVGKIQYLARTNEIHELSCEYGNEVVFRFLVPEEKDVYKRQVMDKLAEHLIEKETITGKEFVAIYEEITGEKLKRSGEEKQKEEVKELPQNEEE